MLLGHGLVVGFVLGIAATIMVQRRLRKGRLKLTGAPRSVLNRLWGSFFGKSGGDDHRKGGHT